MPALLERHHELLDLLVQFGRSRTFRPLPVADEPVTLTGPSLWWVRQGQVRRYRLRDRPILVDLHGPGAVVSPDEAPPGSDADEQLVAAPGAVVVEFQFAAFAEIARHHPEAATMLVSGLAHHQASLRRRLEYVGSRDRAQRMTALLSVLAGEIGQPCAHGRDGWMDVAGLTHQDLADLCSGTRPHVTGVLARLVAAGRIARPAGRILCVRGGSAADARARRS